MEVRAVTKFTGISAQKARLVVDEVRGRDARRGDGGLAVYAAVGGAGCRQDHQSALANATENFGLEADDMYIAKIVADDAPTRKWRRFGARGRFKPWIRRSSHITVVLAERVESQ